MNLKDLFAKHCEENNYEINQNQLDIINNLKNYYKNNFKKNFFSNIFRKKELRLGFYLVGDVGVGKTMILNFFFNQLEESKIRFRPKKQQLINTASPRIRSRRFTSA